MPRHLTIFTGLLLLALGGAAYLAINARLDRMERAIGVVLAQTRHVAASAPTHRAPASQRGRAFDPRQVRSPSGFPPGEPGLRLQLSRRLQNPATRLAGAQPTPARPPAAAPQASQRTTPGPAPAAPVDSPSREPATPAAPPAAAQSERPGWFARLLGREPTDTLDDAALTAGLKDALRSGTDLAAESLSGSGGYLEDPDVAIELPKKLEAVRTVLQTVGMAALMDDLRLRINEAADLSTPAARNVFQRAITDLEIAAPREIAEGGPDAATRYLESRMLRRIVTELQPVLEARLAEVGALTTYTQAMGVYNALPFVPAVEGDLTFYTASRVSSAILHHIGLEEARIRSDPARRTTVALQSVFGARGD